MDRECDGCRGYERCGICKEYRGSLMGMGCVKDMGECVGYVEVGGVCVGGLGRYEVYGKCGGNMRGMV